MAVPAIINNLTLQQGNGSVYLSWDGTAGATSYSVQRSVDGVNFSPLATPAANSYTDSAVSLGTQYWYQVAGTNGSGTGLYTAPQSAVPAPNGELSLGELRLRAQQRADRLDSQYITTAEWNFFIMQALYELYDLLIDTDPDPFMAPRARFTTNGTQFIYPLPDGATTFQNVNNQNFIPAPFYKLMGIDLALQTNNTAFVTVDKFNLIDRNKYVYPNSASTIYGVFNLQYRLLGNNSIEFIPTPTGNQVIQILFVPRLRQLALDTDLTTIGFSGWLQYVIVRAAKYALDKEESDTTKLDEELLFLKGRIEESSTNRDAGRPDTISDSRSRNPWGFNGPGAGW